MFAVIKTGGKQYRVSADDVIEIERLQGDQGNTIDFTDVLMVGEGDNVTVGAPLVSGAKVTAELVEQSRGPKLIAFKKRRRKSSKRKRGHRQDLTKIRITGIEGA
ncbi:MAG: 50S ribosomal protein L21 [Pseudomonadota bacterium]